MTQDEEYERGLVTRRELFGREVEQSMGYFKELAPELDKIIVTELFGNSFARTAIDPRTRCLCTIGILAALGKESAVKNYTNGALNLGVEKQEIIEVLMQLFFYAGLPAASAGLRAANEVFEKHGLN